MYSIIRVIVTTNRNLTVSTIINKNLHRGTDGSGFKTLLDATFSHHRLSISNLSRTRINIDDNVGISESIGFRSGTSRDYQGFCHRTQEELPILVRPLTFTVCSILNNCFSQT